MALARALSTWPTARRRQGTEHPRVLAPRISIPVWVSFLFFFCVFIVLFCFFETGPHFVALSGLELTAILLPQLLGAGRTGLRYAPSPPIMPCFLSRLDPPGREIGVLDGVARLWISQQAAGEAGPKEFPVSSSLQFVVCGPSKLQAVSVKDNRGFVFCLPPP